MEDLWGDTECRRRLYTYSFCLCTSVKNVLPTCALYTGSYFTIQEEKEDAGG